MERLFSIGDCGKDVYHVILGKGYIQSIDVVSGLKCDDPGGLAIACSFPSTSWSGRTVVVDAYGRPSNSSPQVVFKGPVKITAEAEYDCWDEPPASLKVDDHVVIKDGYGQWVNRHFARWEKVDGQWVMYVFCGGLTSHSSVTYSGFTDCCASIWKIPK